MTEKLFGNDDAVFVLQGFDTRHCLLEKYSFAACKYRVVCDWTNNKVGNISLKTLEYDISGRTEPLFSNIGNPPSIQYSPIEIASMERIR